MRGPEGAPVQQCTGATRQVRGAAAEVHQEIADLLGSPGPVRVRGDPEDVHVTRTDLDNEQHVQALERDRAVDMEDIPGA